MNPSRTHRPRSSSLTPADAHQSRLQRLSRLRHLLGNRRPESSHHSQDAPLSPHSIDALPQSHRSPSHTLHANDECQDTHSADIAQRLKSAVQTSHRSLKLALAVADKVNDIIPIPAVNAVIGGLQVLLERQDVCQLMCFLTVADHTAAQCRQCRHALTASRPYWKPV